MRCVVSYLYAFVCARWALGKTPSRVMCPCRVSCDQIKPLHARIVSHMVSICASCDVHIFIIRLKMHLPIRRSHPSRIYAKLCPKPNRDAAWYYLYVVCHAYCIFKLHFLWCTTHEANVIYDHIAYICTEEKHKCLRMYFLKFKG